LQRREATYTSELKVLVQPVHNEKMLLGVTCHLDLLLLLLLLQGCHAGCYWCIPA
jgi:hypothetical protein